MALQTHDLALGQHRQMPGWSSIGSLPWNTVTDRLSFCPLHTLQPLAVGPSSAPNFLTDWSMAAHVNVVNSFVKYQLR